MMRRILGLSLVAAIGAAGLVGGHGAGVFNTIDVALAQGTDSAKKREAQRKKRGEAQGEAAPDPAARFPAVPVPVPQPAQKLAPEPERIEADVSTRTIAVTSGFTGTEIIVFGAVDNSRQTSAEAGLYDIVVVVEGEPKPLTVRRKSNVAGLWANTDAASFEGVPSYYAVSSTRPIDEIADQRTLEANAIGVANVRLSPSAKTAVETAQSALKDYKDAVVRLKKKDGLYLEEDYSVAFIGRSLFRSSIALPANIPLGDLSARVYLFRDGNMISNMSTRLHLEREGVELWIYRLAMSQPLVYGIATIIVAVGAGLLGSALFRRGTP